MGMFSLAGEEVWKESKAPKKKRPQINKPEPRAQHIQRQDPDWSSSRTTTCKNIDIHKDRMDIKYVSKEGWCFPNILLKAAELSGFKIARWPFPVSEALPTEEHTYLVRSNMGWIKY